MFLEKGMPVFALISSAVVPISILELLHCMLQSPLATEADLMLEPYCCSAAMVEVKVPCNKRVMQDSICLGPLCQRNEAVNMDSGNFDDSVLATFCHSAP
jgi:hypothetical protein